MTLKENSAGFGRAGGLAACGPPMRLIVTIARADEVRCVKSRFLRLIILQVFPHNPSKPANLIELNPRPVVQGGQRQSASRRNPLI
jgi:hypothetical protein